MGFYHEIQWVFICIFLQTKPCIGFACSILQREWKVQGHFVQVFVLSSRFFKDKVHDINRRGGLVHGSCFLTAWQPLRQLWRSKHLQGISAAQPCRGQLVAVSWQQRAQPLAKKGVQFLAAPINMTKLPSLTRLLGYIPNYPTDFLPIMWVKQCHKHP